MVRNEALWIKQYEQRNALWMHDGNPKRPHALLSSGKHSSGFFNSELVMEDPRFLDEAVFDLMHKLNVNGLHLQQVDRVVGPAMGAITIAHDMARQISMQTEQSCLRAYTEKVTTKGYNEAMVFNKTVIRREERILLVEDVLTTGGSVEKVVNAVNEAGGIVLPFIGVLVNRSGLKQVNGRRVVSLVERSLPVWEITDCPLCKQGSDAIKPKANENWALLNAEY